MRKSRARVCAYVTAHCKTRNTVTRQKGIKKILCNCIRRNTMAEMRVRTPQHNTHYITSRHCNTHVHTRTRARHYREGVRDGARVHLTNAGAHTCVCVCVCARESACVSILYIYKVRFSKVFKVPYRIGIGCPHRSHRGCSRCQRAAGGRSQGEKGGRWKMYAHCGAPAYLHLLFCPRIFLHHLIFASIPVRVYACAHAPPPGPCMHSYSHPDYFLYLPAVVALAAGTAADRTLPDDGGRLVVLVNSLEAPVFVVVAVVVAVSGGHVSTVQGVLGKVSVAGVRDGLVRVHGRGVGPEGVDGVVAKHALFGRRVRPRVSDNQRCARESCACRQLSTNIIRAPAGGQRHVGQAGD